MRQFKTSAVLLAMFAFVATAGGVMAGCGGGGQGFRADAGPPLVITSTSLPTTLSGESVDFPVELAGGCGGPYVIKVIAGQLPPGVGTDVSVPDGGEPRHHLVGLVLEKGVFNFTLQVTDTNCTPFLTTVEPYSWDIAEGPLQIVNAVPAINTDPNYKDRFYPDIDALVTTVYGTLTAIDLIAAGGQPPYVCAVVDNPDDPLDDNGLPFGMNMAVDSCSLVGTPSSVGPGGLPLRITFRVTDSVGQTATRTLQWTIDTPPIIISNPGLANGTAGAPYSDTIQIVDGVPPFGYELVDVIPGDDPEGVPYSDVDYSVTPPVVLSLDPNHDPYSTAALLLSTAGPSTVNKIGSTSPTTYPPTNAASPYGASSAYPSEGIFMVESGAAGGSILGLPRRVGDFKIMVHAYSLLVPNNRGQHGFRPYTQSIAAPQPLAINPAMSLEGSFTGLPGDGYPTLPEAEKTIIYNPDVISHPAPGMACLATGGVSEDGFKDSPHFTTRLQDLGEVAGRYAWAGDNNWDGLGAITGLDVYDSSGLYGTETQADANGLPRQQRRQIQISVSDQILPDALNVPQDQVFGISVGPDTMILTMSTNSLTDASSWWRDANRHKWNDNGQTILKFTGFSSGPVRAKLDDSDLSATHSVPSIAFSSAPANPLGALLSGDTGGNSTLDLHRPTVVATGWWDDSFGLNPKGGRHGKHARWARGYGYYGQFGTSWSNNGNWQPSVPNIDLPYAEVTADKANGIYADGGRLYVFESSSRFGIFVIREDTTIYVPFAMQKDTAVECFGDGLIKASGSAVNSALQTVQMTISPDGRFAAFKLKRDAQNFYETSSQSQIVLISLTGEKVFGGATYKIIGCGEGLTGGGNRIMHASSMALTNSHLYFLIGSKSATSSSSQTTPLYWQSFSGHFLMHYDLINGAGDALPMTSGDGEWTQASGTSMQTTYHHTGPSWNSTYQLWDSTTSYGFWPYHRYWSEGGMNLREAGAAPTPFRVSANGKAVTFLAGADDGSTSPFSGHANNFKNHAWVCYEGSAPRRITTSRRHGIMGSGRGYQLTHGPDEYAMWGRYTGPTAGLEISDDGLSVAFVYNTQTTTINLTSSYTSSSHAWFNYRENLQLCRTTAGDAWTTLGDTTQRDVTGTLFGGTHKWRFGCLAFTTNTNPDDPSYSAGDGTDQGLIFWGGAPVYRGASSYWNDNQSFHMAGAMYATALGSTSMKSMLGTTEGGSNDGAKTYTSAFNPATTGSTTSGDTSSNRRYGVLIPCGGFMSKNRKFLYLCAFGALGTNEKTGLKLVGLNVSTMASGSINGHTNAQGDIPGSWPARRGFLGQYQYYPSYWLDTGYAPNDHHGITRCCIAPETGTVFWTSGYQSSGPSRRYSSGGPPITTYYFGAYGYGGHAVYGFNADMNGKVAQINVAADAKNSTSSLDWGKAHYMEVTRDGSTLAYERDDYYAYDFHNREMISVVTNLNFDTATGAIDPSFTQANDTARLEGNYGRGGDSLAIPAGNNVNIWYAYKAGASNETQKEMVKAHLNDDGTWTQTRFTALPGRINILHGGR